MRDLSAILFVLAVFITSAAAPGSPASAESGPYTHFPELYDQAKAALEGDGRDAALLAVDTALADLTVSEWDRTTHERLSELMALRAVLDELDTGGDAALRAWLLDHPERATRLFYALDASDDAAGAMDVLVTLRDESPEDFESWYELCVAFAVVWDNFRGHHWVKEPMEPGVMVANYRHYLDNRQLLIRDPRQLPHELGVFVVGTRLRDSERRWVLRMYARSKPASPTKLYASVPWTKVLSPAHGQGAGMDYTLEKIKEVGGVCMEQAYFTENVYRILGVPAVYTRGRGRRGGHAWAGVLVTRPRLIWDFSSGRYTYDRYYRGSLRDPTAPRNDLNEGLVQLTAAFTGKGKGAMSEAYAWMALSYWFDRHWPDDRDKPEAEPLLLAMCDASIKANPYLARSWHRLALLAQQGAVDEATIFARAERLYKLTNQAAPDFLVDRLPLFLEQVEDQKRKATIYANLFRALKGTRADLAAMVKVWEGDLWVEQGRADKAAKAYLYPIASFPKEDHVLSTAKQRLQDLPGQVDEQALEKTYQSIVRGLEKLGDRMQPEQAMAFNLALDGLAKIYDDRGDDLLAERMRRAKRTIKHKD